MWNTLVHYNASVFCNSLGTKNHHLLGSNLQQFLILHYSTNIPIHTRGPNFRLINFHNSQIHTLFIVLLSLSINTHTGQVCGSNESCSDKTTPSGAYSVGCNRFAKFHNSVGMLDTMLQHNVCYHTAFDRICTGDAGVIAILSRAYTELLGVSARSNMFARGTQQPFGKVYTEK